MPGTFITFEGGDGAGKTTQIDLLRGWLVERGHTVVVTREPGGTELGERLREIILHSTGFISPRSEALLYAADRAHHVATLVRPALERGDVVLQDRYLDSSVAYQGAGRVLDPAEVEQLSMWAVEGLVPTVTVLLDLPAENAKQRQASHQRRFDRLEAEDLEFHGRVRQAYLDRAAAEPDRFVVIDATQSIEAIHSVITEKVSQVLG